MNLSHFWRECDPPHKRQVIDLAWVDVKWEILGLELDEPIWDDDKDELQVIGSFAMSDSTLTNFTNFENRLTNFF